MSKKSKLTKRRWEIVMRAIIDGYTITDACLMAQIGRSTFYKWLSDYPDFNEAMVEATDVQCERANQRVRHGYRGYRRVHLNRPSKKYQSPDNVPFKVPLGL